MSLLGSSVKVIKGEKKGYLTAIMYLSPSIESVPFGGKNTCPHATPGCAAACLGHSSGRLAVDGHKRARVRKTLQFFEDRQGFLRELHNDIEAHIARAKRKGMVPCVRLNGASDIAWEKVDPTLFDHDAQFYDYTKSESRAPAWARGEMPRNYQLTFSRAETEANQEAAERVAAAQGNLAVVFRRPPYPETYLGLPVIDGDEDDLRFLDKRGVVVGLKAKGQLAKTDTSGFVVDLPILQTA